MKPARIRTVPFLRKYSMKRILAIVLFLLISPLFLSAQEQPLDLGVVESVIPAAEPSAPAPGDTKKVVPDGEKTDQTAKKRRQSSFLDLVQAGGLIGYVIILLSLVAVALMIEHALTIRQKVMIPPGFGEKVLQHLSQGQFVPALQLCKSDSSVLGQVLYAGMSEYELGWNAVEKGAEEALTEHAARLYRKIEYLNVIGNIAPMLGLLGTVVGMIYAFQQLAESEGYARAADLAEGIYLALVTTVQGLVVAIPSLAAYSVFSNRIAFLVAETTLVAEQVMLPVKKSLLKKGK